MSGLTKEKVAQLKNLITKTLLEYEFV